MIYLHASSHFFIGKFLFVHPVVFPLPTIPSETLKILPWGHIYKGQTQKWFAFQFTGKDSDINVGTENPEFSEWKWTKIDSIINEIVPFKRNVYSIILKEFKDIF